MKNIQIAIRLDEKQLKMLDEKIEQLEEDIPGVTWCRTAAIKYLALMGAKPVKVEIPSVWIGGSSTGTTIPSPLDQVTYT